MMQAADRSQPKNNEMVAMRLVNIFFNQRLQKSYFWYYPCKLICMTKKKEASREKCASKGKR